ncbi:MAG: hypothetical protein HDT21_11425 [Ruminococcus sp.]|nr:hypothetical protein [Ruminococcus sp.]
MSGKWNIFELANGHLSCENISLGSQDIDKIEEIIEKHFGAGILRRRKIYVSYDCWSGVYIMPVWYGVSEEIRSDSDEFVKEIYEFLKASEKQ